MCGGLYATYYQDQSRPYTYSPWYKRSIIKETVTRTFQRHRGLSFETEIRHLSGSFSNLTTRKDQYRKKALEVNQDLRVLCRQKNINIIDYGNTITVRHLNGSKLHLNLKGNKVLTEKFTEAVSNKLH